MTAETGLAKNEGFKRYLQLALIILAAGSLYPLIYLRQNFEVTILETFAISAKQLRDCYSVMGIIFVITYLPSGWLADKVAPKLLMSVSLLVTALLGVWFSTQPGLASLKLIFIGWGITTGLTFWAAMLKAVAVLGKPEEQGRFFGMLDGGRGLVEALLATLAVALFAFAVESLGEHVTQALNRVIWLYVSFMLLLAPAVYFVISDSRTVSSVKQKQQTHTLVADLKSLAAKQEIWLSAACILTGYQLFWATYSFSAYLQVNFGLSAVAVGSITVAKLWMRPIGATIAGFVGDLYDREAVLGILLLSCSLMLFLLTCLPRGIGANALIAVVLAIGLLTYGVRGIWWSTLESCDVDDRTKGLAIGTLSLLAYSPDFYQPYISGLLLEAFPGKIGYDIYYLGIAGFGVLGTVAAFRLRAVVRQKRALLKPASMAL